MSEMLIVYFAFGAPLAVYRYLEARKLSGKRRILLSLVTFLVWLPFALRLLIRHFTNASLDAGFVSTRRKKINSLERDRYEGVRNALTDAGCPLPRHDLLSVIERYAGLSEAAAGSKRIVEGEKAANFFRAAGRSSQLATICLSRKEQIRLRRHLTASRDSFLALFDRLSGSAVTRTKAIRRGMELALVLGDMEAADCLGDLESALADLSHDSESRMNLASQPVAIQSVASTAD